MREAVGPEGDGWESSFPRQRVSVIVPTKDRAQLLEGCLTSLLAQDYPGNLYEIIVIDDASSDGTPAVVERVAKNEQTVSITCLRLPKPKGPATARNTGVRNARGELLCFVDDDIVASPGWITEMVAGAQRHPDAGCLAGRILLPSEARLPRICGREPLGESELDLGESDHIIRHGLTAGNMAAPRLSFAKIGGFDETLRFYGEDTEWQHRLDRAGGKTIYLAAAWVHHRRPASELAIRRILRRRFDKGRAWPVLVPYLQRHASPFGGLRIVVSGLGHAGRRLCWAGLFRAAYGLGYCHEAVVRLLRGEGSAYLGWWPQTARREED